MAQKSGPYTKLFDTLSAVRMMFSILSQLNILCSNLVNRTTLTWRFTRYSPFTGNDHFMRSPTYWISSSGVILISNNVQFSIWSKNSVFNFTAVRYSLHKCCETILCLKRQFTVHVSPVSCALEFMEARKTHYRIVGTSIWSVLYSGELCNQKCIVKTSETLIVWSAFCYTAGSDKSDAIEGCRTNC